MTSDEMKRLVFQEIDSGIPFENFHGITPENVRAFLVEPYQLVVDPDDLETQPRPMWVVLHEYREPRRGYILVFDHQNHTWGVAEFTGSDSLTMVSSAPTMAEALSQM